MSQSEYWDKFMRRRLSRRAILKGGALAGAGLVSGAVFGCSGSQQNPTATATSGAKGTTPAAATTPVGGATPAAAVTAAPKAPTGKVVIGCAELGQETTDPHTQVTGAMRQMVLEIADGPVTRDAKGKLVPNLASKWDFTDEGRTLTLTLRKDVLFHDGSKLTAGDMAFSIKRAMDPALKQYVQAELAAYVTSIDAVGDDKVVIKLSKPYASMLDRATLFMGAVPKAAVEKVGNEQFGKAPISTGPFKFSKQELGNYIELEAWDKHFERVPQVKTVVLKIVPEASTRLAQLKVGEIDIMRDVPGEMINQIKSIPGAKIVQSTGGASLSLKFFDLMKEGNSPTKNKKVRQAISHAIDRETIAAQVYYGAAIPLATDYLPNNLAFDPEMKPHKYDPALAKQLLAEAGFPNGFTIDFRSYAGVKPLTEAVQSYLAAVGINAKIDITDDKSYDAKYRSLTLTGIGLRGFGGAAMYEPSALSVWYQTGGAQCYWSDKEKLDPLMEKTFTETDDAKRADLGKQINRILYDELPTMGIVAANGIYALGPKVAKYDPGVATTFAQRLWSIELGK